MLDHILMVIEILLLVWVVWQGEIIVRCERGVYRLQKEREDERRQWREAKRRQQERRDAAKDVREVPPVEASGGVSSQETNRVSGILKDLPPRS